MSRMLGCGPSKLIADGRADEDVDLARPARVHPLDGDRGADGLLLGRGEHVGDVEVAGDGDVHAGRDVGLRVEVDDERRQALREGGGGKAERHRGLTHSSLEGADAENMHE